MEKNTLTAVMARRKEPLSSLDDFPTPPWATRALLEHVIPVEHIESSSTVLEPACGRGHMVRPLEEYFTNVYCNDIHNYGFEDLIVCRDFLDSDFLSFGKFDWVITNPPFKKAEAFINRAFKMANKGVAVLLRTTFIESVGRYERLFSTRPPTWVAQFVERVPMVRGRVDPKASSATSYAWFVWANWYNSPSQLVWIPPCRKSLEKDSDYPVVVEAVPQAIQTTQIDHVIDRVKKAGPNLKIYGSF